MFPLRMIFGLILILSSGNLLALEAGETVRLHGQLDQDTYAVGGTIFSSAAIAGDLLASGGTLIIDGSVQSDMMLMGGDVTITASVGDDLRITAGSAVIKSTIGGDLLFAGGQLSLSPDNSVAGEAWLAGGQLDLGGEFHKNLHVVASNISLSGHIGGDVRLEGESIRIQPGTRIDGKLTYVAPMEMSIPDDVIVKGGITYQPSTLSSSYKGPSGFVFLTLAITAVIFYLLFSGYSHSVTQMLREDYWRSLGIGLVVFFLIPFVAFVCIGIVIGIWLGLMLLALYAIAVLLGSVLGMICSGEYLARLVHFDISTTGRHLLAIIIAYILLGLLQFIPVLGGLTSFIVLLSGLGAGSRVLYRKYQAA